ncbi:DnaJ domain-containing protein [Marinobacterium aestuariivivens]|uniref:DnaJ domain-containing protein n=1 Tax=Marinobacterium aestuariivivens TaxID=1698799 RepID=A0ABW1ZTI5_9GAMM
MNPIGLIILGAVALTGYLWVQSRPAGQRTRAKWQLIILLVALMLLYLSVTGRMHWLGAVVAALLPLSRYLVPLLRYLPFLKRLYDHQTQRRQSGGNSSRVQTAILEMSLDHDSGTMDGTVLQGPLSGRRLDSLGEHDFIELLQYCRRQDQESARLLEAYLDRRFGDSWRDDDPGERQEAPPQSSGSMSEQEAYAVLGLQPGASEEEIVTAHRRLMQKLHPDRGGSDYLAARINEAKERLLG